MDRSKVIVRDFNTSLSVEQAGKKKKKKQQDIDNLNNMVDKCDLIDIPRHTQQLQNTFFRSLCGTFTTIDHMLSHNASPGKF